MAACRACGTRNVFNLQLQDDPAQAKGLLDKLFHVAKVKLSLEQTEVICVKCAYKIEESYIWLCNIHRYQAQRQARRNPNAFVRPKQVRETFVQENIWKENFTYNFFEEDEDEEIPNAQQYISACGKPSNGQPRNNDKYKTNLEQRAVHAPVEKFSLPFSFLPSQGKKVNENDARKPEDEIQNLDEALSYDFDTYPEPKEELLTKDFVYNERQSKAKDDNLNYTNFANAAKKAIPVKHVNFNGWNLSRTLRNEKSSIIEQKYPYNLRRQQQKDIPDCNELSKRKARPGVRLRGHESSDMFASQDSPTPNAVDWKLSPNEDLIQRVRAKIQRQDF